jgi:hypothetical protein
MCTRFWDRLNDKSHDQDDDQDDNQDNDDYESCPGCMECLGLSSIDFM